MPTISSTDAPSLGIQGIPSLHLAAASGNAREVKRLLGDGSIPDAQDSFGDTPLHYAVYMGHEGIVAALCEAGANLEIRNCQDQTPLHVALHTNRVCLRILVERGADVDAPWGINHWNPTPKMYARMMGLAEAEEVLRDGKGVPCDQPSEQQLFLAVRTANLPKARELLDKGAKIRGDAVYHASEEILPLLAERGIEARVGTGITALHLAALRAESERVERLLAAGANPNARDRSYRTPLSWCVNFKVTLERPVEDRKRVIHALVQHGADYGITGVSDWQNPLVAAIENGDEEILPALLGFRAKGQLEQFRFYYHEPDADPEMKAFAARAFAVIQRAMSAQYLKNQISTGASDQTGQARLASDFLGAGKAEQKRARGAEGAAIPREAMGSGAGVLLPKPSVDFLEDFSQIPPIENAPETRGLEATGVPVPDLLRPCQLQSPLRAAREAFARARFRPGHMELLAGREPIDRA